MDLYLVRHGQTIDAQNNRYQNFDSELSDRGIKDAQTAGGILKKYKIQKIISSPLVRAKQTAELINKALNVPLVYNEYLVEEKRPTEVEKTDKNSKASMRIMKEIADKYSDLNFRYSDEDNFLILKDRGVSLKKYLEEIPKVDTAIVSSGVILKMLISLLIFGESLDPKKFLSISNLFRTDNCGISILQLDFDNTWTLKSWNSQN